MWSWTLAGLVPKVEHFCARIQTRGLDMHSPRDWDQGVYIALIHNWMQTRIVYETLIPTSTLYMRPRIGLTFDILTWISVYPYILNWTEYTLNFRYNMAAVGRTFHQGWSIYCNLALYLLFWTPKWFEIYQERFFFRFFPFLLLFLVPFCQVLENRDCNILTGDGSGFWRPLYWKSPSASLFSSYIKGMSTSVRFRSIIVDCGLGCPTRVSGGFLQSWARADSVVFVHHDSAVSIASLRDCGILPVRCAACFISCYILYVLMLCLVLILCLHAFVYRGRTAHAVSWCRHVFARSCVHMFTCVVFTLGRLARFGCIGLQCARRRFILFIVWELRV